MPAPQKHHSPERAHPSRQTKRPPITSTALLLDTHAFLWFVLGSDQLSPVAHKAIEDPSNRIHVSAASAWEIAINRQIGKLPDTVQFAPSFAGYLKRRGFAELTMTIDHAEAAGDLPLHHRDSFDRMLIAQALCDGMHLVSNEALFDAYGVARVW